MAPKLESVVDRGRALTLLRTREPVKLDACPNCEEPLANAPNFCPTCGQENTDPRGSWTEVLADAWKGFFRIDGKIMRTVWALLTKPGLVADEYSRGKRSRYVTPMKAFLLASTLYFGLAASFGRSDAHFQLGVDTAHTHIHVGDESSKDDVHTNLDKLEKKRAELDSDPDLPAFTKPAARGLFALQRDRLLHGQLGHTFMAYFMEGIKWLTVLLVPVVALLLRLFGPRPRKLYVDAFVFVLYAQTASFALDIVAVPLEHLGFTATSQIVSSLPFMVWLFVALRRYWGTSRLSTALRFAPLFIVCFMLYGLALAPIMMWELAKIA